ncbi:MAG: CDP-alcohol phosphatidyltransferase family protein [Gammaproteobacteria bacterium]
MQQSRRPLESRGSAWARALTSLLLKTRITPDQISLAGIGFALLGSLAVLAAPRQPWLFVAAALGIQLRLLCNLLDGLVAVEGGRRSAQGALYNELPDRLEDSVLLVAFGQAAGLLWLGLLSALLAAITAYVRVLGGTLGFAQDFGGPMAKPHRMAALTAISLLACIEAHWWGSTQVLVLGLGLVALGTAWTIVRRTRQLARRLGAQDGTRP